MQHLRTYTTLCGQSISQLFADPFTMIVIILAGIIPSIIARLPMLSFDENLRLIREQSMALILLLIIVFSILSVLRHLKGEMENGQVALIFCRPVQRAVWFCARVTSVAVVGFWIAYAGLIGTLWSMRIAYQPYRMESFGSNTLHATLIATLIIILVLNYFFNINKYNIS